MALVGNLQDFSLLQLLHLVNQGRKTGCLTIENGDSSALVFFQEGKLWFGVLADQSSVFREGLLKTGKLTRELDEYIFTNYRPVTEKGLALLLEESGILSRDEIVAQEAARLMELMALLSSWDTGTFRFEPEVLPPLESVTVSLGLEGIIMEGSKRIQEREVINDVVPDPDAVLRFAHQQGEKARNTVSLDSDEWRVITSIDGKTTIKAIAEKNGMDDFRVRKLVYGLASAGLVEMERVIPEDESESVARGTFLSPMGLSSRKSIILRLIDRIRRI